MIWNWTIVGAEGVVQGSRPELVGGAQLRSVNVLKARCVGFIIGVLHGYNKSFNGKLRDELFNGEVFYALKEAKVMIEGWRQKIAELQLKKWYDLWGGSKGAYL